MTGVCPALGPPWKRTTISARSDSQSTILPLPSSPHWAPITATFAINSVPYPVFRRRAKGLVGGDDAAIHELDEMRQGRAAGRRGEARVEAEIDPRHDLR